MAENVHGHAILEQIVDAGGQMPLSELKRIAVTNYGSDATYYTCSASGMSFDEILVFLSERNKVRVDAGVIQVFAQNMCNHGGAHEEHEH